jgi:two-component system chemotaxis sensor kinase CheA
VVGHTDEAPDFDELDPEECFTHWDIVLTTDKGMDAIRDVFIFVEDDCQILIEAIDDRCTGESDKPSKRIGEILVERGHISQNDLEKVLAGRKKIGELLVDAGLVEASKVEYALAEQQHIRQAREKHQRKESASNIRVAAEKLDTLVDLVGELVTLQARLTQTAVSQDYSQLLSIAEEVERLTAELRDNTMSIRMQPIGPTFNGLKQSSTRQS